MTLELHATPEEVMRAVETFEKFAREHGASEKAICGLMLALEECGSNVVNHALQGKASEKFQVTMERTGDAFVIQLRDRGPEYDPTLPPEGPSQPKDEDQCGGWGIQLVRRYTDEIRYARKGGENILRLIKRVGEEGKN